MDLAVPLRAVRRATAAELRKLAWPVRRLAEKTILVIGTHFAAPIAGRIVRDGAAFRFAV